MGKILICGGHPSPAIAVIEKLLEERKYEVIYVGQKNSPSSKTESWEYKQLKNFNIKFTNITTGKLKRNVELSSLTNFIRIPIGLYQSYSVLKKEKPDVIVSFGGFIALPIVIWAKLFSIPILTHEQTVKIGLTNKIIAELADTFCISWAITKDQINHKHLVQTGNPLRKEILLPNASILTKLEKEKKPILYITGGGLGSHFINHMIGKIIRSLLKDYIVIHQTGDVSEYQDFEKLSEIKEKLPENLRRHYLLYKHIKVTDIGWIIRNATILVGRSGANTITEILFCHLPSILIPLPWAGANEQKENAKMLEKLGVAVTLEQDKLTEGTLYSKVIEMTKNIASLRQNFTLATDNLVNLPSAQLIVKEIKLLMVK